MLTIDIKQYLQGIANQGKIYYIPNPGNAGDSLIAYGTINLFDELDFDYEIASMDDINAEGKIIVLGGGGNFVERYEDIRNMIESLYEKASKIVLLPHTISANTDLLSRLGSNVDIISREVVSYQHCLNYASGANNLLSDDMALYIDPKRLFDNKSINVIGIIKFKILSLLRSSRQELPSLRKALRAEAIIILKNLKKKYFSASICNCYRTDNESARHTVPLYNFDLSRKFAMGVKSKFCIEYSAYMMMRYVEACDEINTDRLHVCIAASLLGKRVNFHANNYYKNKAVYDFSLKERFAKIRWIEE